MVVSELILLIVAAVGSFAISASAGLGGSLLMVPTMMIIFGPKEGVAVAAPASGLQQRRQGCGLP